MSKLTVQSKPQNISPIRPLSSVPDHYQPDLKSLPKNIPQLNLKPSNPTPLQTEETTMGLNKPKYEINARELIQNKLFKLSCPTHKNRFFDQICVRENCEFSEEKRLFCSKCVIQDEIHVKAHKTNIVDLEGYINEKLNDIEGKELQKLLDNADININKLKQNLTSKVLNAQHNIEKDFQELVQNITSYSQEIAKDMNKKLSEFLENTLKELEEKLIEIRKEKIQMNVEQSYILRDLARFIEIIDISKEKQINEFFKNFLKQNNKFTIERKFSVLQLSLESIENKINPCELYKKTRLVEFNEKLLQNLLDSHFLDNKFLEMPEIKALPIENIITSSIEINSNFELKSPDPINSIDLSLRVNLNTEHLLGINSLEILPHHKLLITCSNDKTVKLWLFNDKLVFILLETLNLPGLCLSLKILQIKDQLFVGSGQDIVGFQINAKAKKQLFIQKMCLRGHKKQIKALEIYENREILISLSQDQTLKVWDISEKDLNDSPIENIELLQDYRIMLKGKGGYLVLGSNSGYIQILQWQDPENLKNLNKVKEIQVSKDAITSLAFMGEKKLVIANKKGRIQGYDLDKFERFFVIKNINKRSLIYGLMPIFHGLESNILMVFSWGGEISVWDVKENKKIGCYQHNLKNNLEKHVNYQGSALFKGDALWIMTSGNDDKELEIIELAIK